ncbi:GNAT family N-acetyltransferase [Bacillus sp. MUM 13]|uniref:GNAT family N-acetyltransferase n=1 Tax=Bacillus sp. MUM 13 TaxID=1678001 RepID=UPI0008F5CEEC|nr:GNAT family N-acetyltransferase [Bacillus sp. MUM 13]OIK08468.1 GNAT family N-acetyltransferase [Bacillus sp. MUM 13]
MIIELDNKSSVMAEKILHVQLPAYQIEANMIGFDGIPQLKDTILDITECRETFVGYTSGDELLGFISYTIDEGVVDICRLVVDPSHFRKGIARELLEHVLEIAGNNKFIVSTGKKNIPALILYQRFGFEKVKDIEVAPGVFIRILEK